MSCTNHPEITQGVVTCRRCRRPFRRNCVVMMQGGFLCATCKTESVRDAQSGVPVGGMELATISRRFGAQFLDNLIIRLIGAVIGVAVGVTLSSATQQIAQTVDLVSGLFVLAMVPVYEGVMLSQRGQTLGKIAAKVKVVSYDGSDLTPGQAWKRAVSKLVLSFCLGITFLAAFFNKERLTLHDRIAKTKVVRLPG